MISTLPTFVNSIFLNVCAVFMTCNQLFCGEMFGKEGVWCASHCLYRFLRKVDKRIKLVFCGLHSPTAGLVSLRRWAVAWELAVLENRKR